MTDATESSTNVTDDPFGPLRRSSLSEEIADRLVSSILAGKFAFGERLPPERDLAKYLDVGRPTLREAFRRLSVIGLIEVRPGEGTFVVDNHAAFVAKAFSWAVLLDPSSTQHVIEARIAIESETARLAARRATPADLEDLQSLLDQMVTSEADLHEFMEHDLAFHFEIARIAQNIMLERMLHAISSLLQQWIVTALRHPSSSQLAIANHQLIVAGLQESEEAAAAAMRAHIEATADLFQESDSGSVARHMPPSAPLAAESHDFFP